MVSRKRNKGKTRRALKAEKERFAMAKAIEAEIALRLVREEAEAEAAAAAAAAVERKSPQNELEDANKNIFGSDNLSPDEAEETSAKLVLLTRKRRSLFTSFSRYDIHVGDCTCVHGLVPCTRSQPHGFVNALIDEYNLIYGRLHVLDRDVVAFATDALLAVFTFTEEKYDA
eukprot:scaffold35017_cov150-Skeletonema_dohrnii-CCMP3373.AAC.1